MSLFNVAAFGQQQRQTNQGWSHSKNFSHNTVDAFGNSVKDWSSAAQQNQASPGLSVGSDNGYAQDVNSFSSQGDAVTTDEPGTVIGREEVILADQNSMAASGYQSSNLQNHLPNAAEMPTSYNHTPGLSHFTELQGSAQLPSQPDFSAQQSTSKQSHVQMPQLVLEQFNMNRTMNQRLQQSYSQHQVAGQSFHVLPPYPVKQLQGHLQSQGPHGNLGQQTFSQAQSCHLQGMGSQVHNSHGQMQGVSQHQRSDSQQQFANPHCFSQQNHLPGQQQGTPLQSHNQHAQLQVHQGLHSQAIGQQTLLNHYHSTFGQHSNMGPQSLVHNKPLHGQDQTSGQQCTRQQSQYSHQTDGSLKLIPHFDDQTNSHQRTICSLPSVSQQLNTQTDHHLNQQTKPQKHLRLMQILNQPSVSLHNSVPSAQNINYGNSSNSLQDQHTLESMSSLQTHSSTPASVCIQTHQSFQSQQTLPTVNQNHTSQQPIQDALQNQMSVQAGLAQQQTFSHDARYSTQPQPPRSSVDQKQQQQPQKQQGQDKELLLVIQPKPPVAGGSLFIPTQVHEYESASQYNVKSQQDCKTRQMLQHSPKISAQVTVHTAPQQLSTSPQMQPQTPGHQSLDGSSHLVPTSSQLALQSSQQLSLQNSPQMALQSSPRMLQNTHQILMIQSPQLSLQTTPQICIQNNVQTGQLPQVIQCSQGVLQSSSPLLQVQNTPQVSIQNLNHVVQVQNLYPVSLPDSKPPVTKILTQTSFQGCPQAEMSQNGGNQLHLHSTVSESKLRAAGRSRGQQRQGGNRGGRGGGNRGCRGRARGTGKADSLTGLHMASSHFRSESAYTAVSDSACVEASGVVSNTVCNQEQKIPELNIPTPKHEQGNSPPVQGTELTPMDNYSPPSVSSVPRLSATNEVWPTPMPSVKQERSDSPPPLLVESLSSCSQQSSDCPVFSPSSCHDEIKPSPPVPQISAAQDVTPAHPPPQVQPVAPSLPEQKPEEKSPKHKLAEDEEGTAVCKYCGYCSSNFKVCEGCNRKLPDNVKVVVKKRKLESSDSGSERERTCGGGKVNASPANSGGPLIKKSGAQSSVFLGNVNKTPDNVTAKTTGRTYTRRRGTGRGGARGRKNREPVTVTISSDEDDDPSSDHTQRLSNSSVTNTPTTQDEEDDFFSSHLSKPTSAFGTSRRNKMMDASGQCVQQCQAPAATAVGDGIYFQVRGVRIGTMRTSGLEVRFREGSIGFRLQSDRSGQELDFHVNVVDITGIRYSLNQSQPVAFIKVTPECGLRLRTYLKMTQDSLEFFDPSSQDLKKSMIVVIIDAMISETGLRHTLENYSRVQNLTDFLQELNFDDANHLLVQSSPPVIKGSHGDMTLQHFQQFTSSALTPNSLHMGDQGDSFPRSGQMEVKMQFAMAGDAGMDANDGINNHENKSSGTPSPKARFVGPVEKLLSYPPAPAKGAITITNEDLYCLNEGEFLNDVILDFYLKYLVFEKLSEEDRERTHVFSSFFYKRLTHRQSPPQDCATKMTPAQRRHSRVKTWTRHVDIFSKDFLLIPINESSHWFLAVVCFPGLEAQEHVSIQPAAPAQHADGQSGSTQSNSSQKTEQDQTLGKVEVLKKDKCVHGMGLRQACILVMDSLMGPSRNNVIKTLKEYLQVEWDLKKGRERNMSKTVRGAIPKVPQQTNYSDCGVFVLQYAESIFDQPIPSFAIPMKLENWFPLSKVEKKRDEIRQLILRLGEESSR